MSKCFKVKIKEHWKNPLQLYQLPQRWSDFPSRSLRVIQRWIVHTLVWANTFSETDPYYTSLRFLLHFIFYALTSLLSVCGDLQASDILLYFSSSKLFLGIWEITFADDNIHHCLAIFNTISNVSVYYTKCISWYDVSYGTMSCLLNTLYKC